MLPSFSLIPFRKVIPRSIETFGDIVTTGEEAVRDVILEGEDVVREVTLGAEDVASEGIWSITNIGLLLVGGIVLFILFNPGSTERIATTGIKAEINLFQLFQRQLRLIGSFGCNMRNIETSLEKLAAGLKGLKD